MSDPQRDRSDDPELVREAREERLDDDVKPVDDRGGFRDTAPNPHDEQGATKTAAQATGAMTAMMLPAVILAIIAIAVILYFVL